MSQKTALITGITGQDGSYLAEFLLNKNYRVIGFQQISATPNTQNIVHLEGDIDFIHGDMTDSGNINHIIKNTQPDEIYNLAGQSHVGDSFTLPELTAQINGIGVLKFLEAIRLLKPDTKFYQASTSEIFGNNPSIPFNENTPLKAESPYAAAKIYAHNMIDVYRKSYGLFACCGILFNHESPRRGEDFVTQKICKDVAAIVRRELDILTLGNLDARRDWRHAKDYVRGMWVMMQSDHADDFVLATGQSHSVREFVERAFHYVDIPITWDGNVGRHAKTNVVLVKTDPALLRPNDIDHLIGDFSKMKTKLGWHPEYSFDDVVATMMDNALQDLACPVAKTA
jgi:GDPmannose 4,6-dehydratase